MNSPEVNARLKKPKSPEHIENLRLSHTGLKDSPETKKKKSLATLGKKKSPEHCKNIGLAKLGNKYFLGKKHSEETRAKLRLARSKQVFKEETREKLKLSHIGIKDTQETKEKKSLSAKLAWQKRKMKV
jgi:hypothetical protein